jgi:hypothetical protein
LYLVAAPVAIDDRPSCFRYPRGNGIGVDLAAEGIGKDLKGTPLEVRAVAWRRQLREYDAQWTHSARRACAPGLPS